MHGHPLCFDLCEMRYSTVHVYKDTSTCMVMYMYTIYLIHMNTCKMGSYSKHCYVRIKYEYVCTVYKVCTAMIIIMQTKF